MTTEPYASAQRVFLVVDNGSSHRGQASIDRLAAWPTARLVHLPVHASWLDQIEIYFSILQREDLAVADAVGHQRAQAQLEPGCRRDGPAPILVSSSASAERRSPPVRSEETNK